MSKRGYWYRLASDRGLGEIYQALAAVGLFPEGGTWWFGWNGAMCALPSVWEGSEPLDQHWDHFRLFSGEAELRAVRRAGKLEIAVLSERQDLRSDLSDLLAGEAESFEVKEGKRILAGRRMALRGAEGGVRGEIVYPHTLSYGIRQDDPDKALVAEVRSYWRDGLRFTDRYCRIALVEPGSIRLDEERSDEAKEE